MSDGRSVEAQEKSGVVSNGDHCARSAMGFFGIPASGRTSANIPTRKRRSAAQELQAVPEIESSTTSSRLVFKDFDQFADAIRGIAGRFVPTARSEADWWVQAVPVCSVVLQQIQIGGASTFAGDGTDNMLTVGIPMADSRRIRIDGQSLDDDSFILVKEGQPFTFAANQSTQWAGVTVPIDHHTLSADFLAKLRSSSSGSLSATRMRARLETISRARALICRMCTEDSDVAFLDPAAARAAEEEIMTATTHLLESSSPPMPMHIGRPQLSRGRVIARALSLMKERQGEPLLMDDLCNATQVGESTLRTIFQETFGVGPMRLLKVRQLSEIRGALMSPSATQDTVTKIAARFGIWDYSLFARNYKALYGESPIETLRHGLVRNGINAASSTWLRHAAHKLSDAHHVPDTKTPPSAGDRVPVTQSFAHSATAAALANASNPFDKLILQQQRMAQEIKKYEIDLHGFAAWAKDFLRSQCGKTPGAA